MIKILFVLNGNGDYAFNVGELSPIGMGRVTKIKENSKRDNAYIVFLDSNYELDIISNNVIVYTKI